MKAEEIIQMLRKSVIPTVLVEGVDDVKIYRWLEKELSSEVDFLPCGGRKNLLEVFHQREQFKNLKTLFIADQDMYAFMGIPKEYEEVFFTKGYSIENDLFTDGEKRIDELLEPNELRQKQAMIENLSKWFAFEVETYLQNPSDTDFAKVKLASDKVMGRGKTEFSDIFLNERKYKPANETLFSEILANYSLKIRGKFLFQLIQNIFLQRDKGKFVTYTDTQLQDLCFREGKKEEDKTSCVQRMLIKVKTHFQDN